MLFIIYPLPKEGLGLNPILQEYMKNNNIRTVIDKKNVILADTKLEITSSIIAELDKKLKSLNLK